MSEADVPTEDYNAPGRYAIRLRGHLDARWAPWLGGLAMTQEPDGTTMLSGIVADQAALHGLLRAVRDLGLPLIALNRVESECAELAYCEGCAGVEG